MSVSENEKPRKLCFVTIGATAGFDALIRRTLSDSFLRALYSNHFTDLRIQYGKDVLGVYKECKQKADAAAESSGINVTGFTFKSGLEQEMRDAKGGPGKDEGVVISHAGSGSILAALRFGIPLIVVPNPELLDNHQLELAEQLAKQGYVVHGHLDRLPAALEQAEVLRHKQNAWPPKNTNEDPSGRGLAGVMDDEMGFVD